MKTLKLKDICSDIFAGAALFTNDALSREHKPNGFRVIRLADIQNNELSFDNCLFFNKQDYSKNRYLLQDNDILISSRGTIFKVVIFQKQDNYKTIPSGFLSCIRLNTDLNISVNYIAAYLRHKESSIISTNNSVKKSNSQKPKIQLKLLDIYNIEIPIVSNKIQKEIDKLSQEATDFLNKSIEKTKEIDEVIKGY